MTDDDALIEATDTRAKYVYQVRSPRSDWLEVDAQDYGRIKNIKGFDSRRLMVVESVEKG